MTFRDFWLEYRSEVFFGVVLAALTVFSYWAAAFIPELLTHFFEGKWQKSTKFFDFT